MQQPCAWVLLKPGIGKPSFPGRREDPAVGSEGLPSRARPLAGLGYAEFQLFSARLLVSPVCILQTPWTSLQMVLLTALSRSRLLSTSCLSVALIGHLVPSTFPI